MMLVIPGESLVLSLASDGSAAARPQPSGAPAIAAWVAARLGIPTVFLGAVGNDAAGALIGTSLASGGVEPAGLVVKAGLPTAHGTVTYFADGSRSFRFAVASSAAIAFGPGDLGSWPERATWVHVSGSAVLFGGPLAAAVEQAVRRGRAVGAVVSVDPNLRAELDDPRLRRRLAVLCRDADVLFPSDGELEGLGLDEDRLVAAGAAVCHTSAEAGARIRVGALDCVVPAVAAPHQVLDPDGAGDTFAGAVIAARMHGMAWPAAVQAASGVVARAIAVAGPMTADLAPADLIAAGPA